MIILLNGKNRVGKDTFSDYLVKHYNFVKLDIVKQLKISFCDLYDITMEDLENNKDFFRYNWNLDDLKNIDKKIYNKIKSSFEKYSLNNIIENENFSGLVELSEDIRKDFGRTYWIERCYENNKDVINSKNVIFTNFRDPDELSFMRSKIPPSLKLITVRINCEDDIIIQRGGTINSNFLEVSMDKDFSFNYTINNNDTLDEYYLSIEKLMNKICVTKTKGNKCLIL